MEQPLTLGELELALLDHLWEVGPRDVKAAHQAVGAPKGITLNTVQSALKRLNEKELLTREKVSHAYLYAPAIDRAELHRRLLGQVVDSLMGGQPEAMVSAFVDLAEQAGPEQLDRLEQLIAARRGKTGAGE